MNDNSETTTDIQANHRAAYTAGLRHLADLLDQQPALPIPNDYQFSWYLFSDLPYAAQKSEAARLVRLLPGKVGKVETGDLFRFTGHFSDSLSFQVVVDRPAVCERIITGTETITVPAVEAQPERTEERDLVEWRCAPLLADDAEQVSA